MKMSKEAKAEFDKFVALAYEKATDNDVKLIIGAVAREAAASKKRELGIEFNEINPLMSKELFDTLVEFFKDFLSKASDDEAIYLIASIKAICKNAIEHPKEVSKFVESVKNKGTK